MTEIPQIVRQRLIAGASPEIHPDPDLLAAFAEKRLTGSERQPITEHLSACADCREVVFLSIPPTDSAEAHGVEHSRWITWPVLRWAAAAACVVVVGAAVTLHFQGKGSIDTHSAERRVLAVDQTNSPAKVTADAGRASKNAVSSQLAPEALRAPAAPAQQGAVEQFSKVSPALPKTTATSEFVYSRTGNATPPARGDAVTSRDKDVVLAQAEPALGKAKEAEQKSAPAARARMEAAAGASAGELDQLEDKKAPAENVVVVPRWTLSAEGALQRSLDGGSTWENIAVATKTKFQALAAFGVEIWVGGAAGALYHSRDAGIQWMQVKPVDDGNALTADIIGVEFVDPKHGKLTTTGDQTWLTADGGQTWTRQ
jgi:hypothetical protein